MIDYQKADQLNAVFTEIEDAYKTKFSGVLIDPVPINPGFLTLDRHKGGKIRLLYMDELDEEPCPLQELSLEAKSSLTLAHFEALEAALVAGAAKLNAQVSENYVALTGHLRKVKKK